MNLEIDVNAERANLNGIEQTMKKEFEANRRILNFDEYLSFFKENVKTQARGSAQYCVDMMDHFGTQSVASYDPHSQEDGNLKRFKLFDKPIDGISNKVVGQEWVQNQIYRSLKGFARQGINNKLILLHGPNGSAKSSIIHAIMGGLEAYSKKTEGAFYSFNWIFPLERYTKGSIGINTYKELKEKTHSFAKLPDEEIAARIPCELKDHPLLIVPQEQRFDFLEKLLGKETAEDLWKFLPAYLKRGDLCHRCKQIFDALLTTNGGDFKALLMHIQVERLYFSRRYRKGLVTIEPQLHVDAQYHQLTYNKSLGLLPASLQGINLFTLTGDLVEGNRGVIEYSDLLKRPVDSFKYLLSACETGSVNIGNSIAFIDAVMLGSTNEVQLDAFKEFPDFTSFKARIELIRVPYLLSVQEEEQIYLGQLLQMAGEKHVAPHIAWTVGLWSVLTRLKKPNNTHYSPALSALISNINPLDKSKLYATEDLPGSLSLEERKLLKANIKKLREEYVNIPYYEGRIGASAREMKSILFDAAQNSEFPCLSPLAVLRELEEFVKRVSEYEFLTIEIKEGYHDASQFIKTVRNEYLNKIDREVRDSIGLYNAFQWEDFIKKYVHEISHLLKKEKVKNLMTGQMENPDLTLIDEFEKIVGVPRDDREKDLFRQNIISQIGVWSLDHPKETVAYARVFPEFWNQLEKHYFESQKSLLTQMSQALLIYDQDQEDSSSTPKQLARQTVENMKKDLGYCAHCAKEVITFLMHERY